MEGNPFAHIVNGFTPVIGKYIGNPATGQTNPLPSALAAQGGTSAQSAQQVQPQQQVPTGTPEQTPSQLTRVLPNMQTTPRTSLSPQFQAPHQAPPVLGGNPPGPLATGQQNPFLSYLNQMFGPGANRQTNLKFPSYLRNIPIAGNRAPNPIANVQNPYNITLPQQSGIPQDITAQIGPSPLPDVTPYFQPNATGISPAIGQGNGVT